MYIHNTHRIEYVLWPAGAFQGIERFEPMYIYLYACVTHTLYTLLRKFCHSRGFGQLMGVVRNKKRA